MLTKVILIGNSEEFRFSMKLFPEMLLRLLEEKGVPVLMIRPKTIFGKLAPWAGRLGKWLFYIDKFLLFPFYLRRTLRQERAPGLVVHVCDHSNAMYVRCLSKVANIVTCHDMMPIRSALGEIARNPTSWTGRCFQRMILKGLKNAKFVVCVSTATQRDFLRIAQYPKYKTQIVFNSLHYPYTPMPETEARVRAQALIGADAPFLLHVGGDAWYKNRGGLVAMYAEMRRIWRKKGTCVLPKLVHAGPPLDNEVRPFLEEDPEMEVDMIGLQDVDNEDLRALYSCAELLLFPSWNEGFGWPIIEAHACGCRVVTTNKAPMTEVGGSAAFYIEPLRPTEAVATILKVLDQEPVARLQSVENGLANAARFSEDRMISDYIETYRHLVGERKT